MVPLWWVLISYSDLAILQTYEELCMFFQGFERQYLLQKKKLLQQYNTSFFFLT